ncbi:hypothetical protein [Thermomonospora catenispora]|uniref:hypothetical protein n=1 Tax=Thermomonospora catenispora TaxID=2493090 RepID=UPI00112412BD|nr:hypothetical protein [Thermomonospora catenispora]TNY34765.1 hypothetical protein EIO00_22070 [Thermomonospora catenispora]
MFLIIAAVALIALISSVVYLIDFALATRHDSLRAPASSGGVRRARRVSGMYVRSREEQLTH